MNIRQKMIACGAISVLAATLLGGLPLRGGAVKDSRDVVRKWVQGLNLTK